jgi:hypothetical protein
MLELGLLGITLKMSRKEKMAKNQFHTSYQKGIIKRFYENKSDIGCQKLSETISDLYLETNSGKKLKLWGQARTALINMGVDQKEVDLLIKAMDLTKLAKYLEEKF